MKPTQQNPNRQVAGFTLTEVLVVIAIIAVLAVVALTMTRRAMDSSYATLKPVITFITLETPTGGMRLASIRNPEKVWMFGDGGRPLGAADSNRYQTVAAIERYGKSWASANRPAFRHNGGKSAHYAACDGHVETLTRKDIENIDNGAFGKFNGSKVAY